MDLGREIATTDAPGGASRSDDAAVGSTRRSPWSWRHSSPSARRRSTARATALPLAAASVLGVVLAFGCNEAAPPSVSARSSRIEVDISGMPSGPVARTCYTLSVANERGEQLFQQSSLCSDAWAIGATTLEADVPCDPDAPTTVATLVVDSVTGPSWLGPAMDTNLHPCASGGCQRVVRCPARGSANLDFSLEPLSAHGEFVEVSVELDALACSAKLDCLDPAGSPLRMLHNELGERDRTVVAALDCRTTSCVDPAFVYSDDVVVACDEGIVVVDAGGAGLRPWTGSGPDVFGAMVFRGHEASGTGVYSAIALGFRGGTNCVLTTRATISEAAFTPATAPTAYPIVEWSVALTDGAGELVCARHPLDGSPPGVSTVYPTVPAPFDHETAVDDPSNCGAPPTYADLCPETALGMCQLGLTPLACPGWDVAMCEAQGAIPVGCGPQHCAVMACLLANPGSLACMGTHSFQYIGPACGPEVAAFSACLTPPVCGNGVTEGSEACDDGNANDTDGCDTACTLCGDADGDGWLSGQCVALGIADFDCDDLDAGIPGPCPP